MKKLKVTLEKSFEFRLDELNGSNIDEKTNDAVSKARTRLNQLLVRKNSRVLTEERVTIFNSK